MKKVWEKTLGKSHPNYAVVSSNLALLYLKQKQLTKAEYLGLEAVNIREKTLGKYHINYAKSCNILGNIYTGQGLFQQAEKWFKKGNQALLKQIEINFTSLSEDERAQFLYTFKKAFEQYNAFILKSKNTSLSAWIYNNALTLKGLLFRSSKKMRQRILNNDDQQLKEEFQTWQVKKDFLAQLYTLPESARLKKGYSNQKIIYLEKEINSIEKNLSLKSQLFATVNEKLVYTWKDVQKKLEANEAAVEIIRTTYTQSEQADSIIYIACIVKPETEGAPEVIILPNGKELEKKYLSYYYNSIIYKRNDRISYDKYWSPIVKNLKNIKKIYLSADGVYHQINLNTLYNQNNNSFLIQELDIQILGSTLDLIVQKNSLNKTNKSSLLIGRPKYNLNADKQQELIQSLQKDITGENEKDFYTLSEVMAKTQWSDLAGTEQEVRRIHQFFQNQNLQSKLFLHENALEEVIKQTQNPKVLHIATHGFFMENNSANDNTSGFTIARLKNNPMMRSGIVLAGVGSFSSNQEVYQKSLRIDDGILTAYEAMNLDLDQTELVVLSACQTGRGQVQNGEGVYGLQRGFQAAGAQKYCDVIMECIR